MLMAYISIIVKKFNIPFLRVILECLVLAGLMLHYMTQLPLSYPLIIQVVHIAFVFFLFLSSKAYNCTHQSWEAS